MKAFIIHGSFSGPDKNWFPWLKSELESAGFQVFVPEFPTPEGQNLESWLKVFKDYEDKMDEDTIIIGHSLGCAFILNVLEKLKNPLCACFLVSSFTRLENNLEVNKTFTDRDFDWDKIKKGSGKFFVIHSDNDPHIPLEKAKEIADSLDAEFDVVKDGGHFNEESGYTEFPFLLRKILEVTP